MIKIGGSQFKVAEGEEITVAKIASQEGDELAFDQVFLLAQDTKVKIGTPYVKGAKVTAQVKGNFLGEKLHIYKFKAKTGYRRKTGFRPQQTKLKIEKITS